MSALLALPQKFGKYTRRTVYSRLPHWFKDNGQEFEVFTGILCIFAALPIVTQAQRPDAAIAGHVPVGVYMIWYTMLIFGPVLIITGLIKANRKPPVQALFWLRIRAAGLACLAYSGYFYSFILLAIFGLNPGVALILIFSFTCHVREMTIQELIEEFLVTLRIHNNGIN